jgi:hypothetical protein
VPEENSAYASLSRANPHALIIAGFDHAYIGHTVGTLGRPVAVYDYEECIDSIVGEGDITEDEAVAYFVFHTLSQCQNREDPPIFVRRYQA